MIKLFTTSLLFLLIQFCSHGQKKTDFHPELFSEAAVKKAKELEKTSWSEFFVATAEPLKEGKINDAALLYFIGGFRYRYYIVSHTEDEIVDDKNLYASLDSVIGDEIILKSSKNIVNLIKIMDAIIEWVETTDNKFYSKKVNPLKYNETLNEVRATRQEIIDNKDFIIEKMKELENKEQASSNNAEKKARDEIRQVENKLYTGKFDEAAVRETITAYSSFIKMFPKSEYVPDMLLQSADHYRSLKEYDAALECYEKLLVNYPDSYKAPNALFLQGFVYENELFKPEKAKEIYQKFLSEYPNHSLADDVKYTLKFMK